MPVRAQQVRYHHHRGQSRSSKQQRQRAHAVGRLVCPVPGRPAVSDRRGAGLGIHANVCALLSVSATFTRICRTYCGVRTRSLSLALTFAEFESQELELLSQVPNYVPVCAGKESDIHTHARTYIWATRDRIECNHAVWHAQQINRSK